MSIENNFQKDNTIEEVSFDVVKYNRMLAILPIPFCCICLFIYSIISSKYVFLDTIFMFAEIFMTPDKSINFVAILISLFFVIVIMVVNEVVRAIMYALFAKNGFKSVHVGVVRNPFTIFATCKEKIYVYQYRIINIVSILIVTLIPIFLGVIFNSIIPVLFAWLASTLSTFSIMLLWQMRKEYKYDEVLVYPTGNGYCLYRNSELKYKELNKMYDKMDK